MFKPYPCIALRPSCPRQVIRRTSCRASSVVQTDTPIITVPIDYYKLLGVNRASSKELVRRSYERVVKAPTDLGYSEDALYTRAALLKAAVDTLGDVESRRAYDQQLFKEMQHLHVGAEEAVGALILMQETGQHDATIRTGQQLLQQNPPTINTRDVAIAIALAYCDRSAEAAEIGASATVACEDLEAALELLEKYNAAPQVQAEIVEALEEYAPRYALELIALPLGLDHQALRAKGCSIVRHLAWGRPDVAANMATREQLLAQAKPWLTAAEQIALYTNLPDHARVSASEVLDTALAYIAQGFSSRQAVLIQKADHMLARVAAAAAQLPPDESSQLDVAVERAVCSVLLGNPDAAADLLLMGQSDDAAEAVAFVQGHAGDDGDPLPGLVAMSETWLAQAALGSFREHSEQGDGVPARLSLNGWFEDSSVQLFLKIEGLKEKVRPGNIVAMLQSMFSKKQEQEQQQLEEQGASTSSDAAEYAQSKHVRQEVTLPAAGAAPAAAAEMPASASLQQQQQQQLAAEQESDVDLSNISQLAGDNRMTVHQLKSRLSRALEDDKLPPAAAAAAAAAAVEEEQQHQELEPPVLPEQPSPAATRSLKELEVQMWDTAPEDPLAQLAKGAAKLLAGAALLLAAAHVARGSRAQPPPLPTTTSQLQASTATPAASASASILSRQEAEQLLRSWVKVKSAALGKQHDAEQLEQLLAGPMLAKWQGLVASMKEQGLRWEYDLGQLRVEGVGRAPGGFGGQEAVDVTVSVQEAARLLEGSREVQRYDTSCRMVYRVQKSERGWRIVACDVVGQSK